MILAVSGWGEGGRGVPLLAEVVSCHEGSVFVPSYISRGTPRAAKGAAASTSSQPQAVMDSSADTSAPLASRLAGGESLGGSCRNRLLKGACPQTKTTQTERQPTRTEAHRERVPPQAISGSEADSMSRGGYPVTGRPPSKSSSIRHMPSAKRPPQSAVFSFSAATETDAASRRSCPSTSRFVRATDSTKSCHGTSVMPTSPRWPFSPSSQRPVTG